MCSPLGPTLKANVIMTEFQTVIIKPLLNSCKRIIYIQDNRYYSTCSHDLQDEKILAKMAAKISGVNRPFGFLGYERTSPIYSAANVQICAVTN